MGMFDTVTGVPVKCPKCGDASGKSVQIKSGPQMLLKYKFGEDKIPLNWDYIFYGAVAEKIDDTNGKIRGVAECPVCRAKIDTKLEEIIARYKNARKIICPEEREEPYLFECEIDGKSALKVVFEDLDNELKTDHHSEYLFDAILIIKDGIVIDAFPESEMHLNS